MVLTMTSTYPSWALEFVKNPTKLAGIIFSGKIFMMLYLKLQKRASTMTVKVHISVDLFLKMGISVGFK